MEIEITSELNPLCYNAPQWEGFMILVTGGTGFIGRHLVKRLMEENQPIRLLLTEERLPRLHFDVENAPQVIVGSILDEEITFRAVSGVHTIYHLENAQWWGRSKDLERVEVFGTRMLMNAARAARVGRVITLSHLGATPSSAYPLMRYKGMVEEIIRTSGLAYTIIRSGVVFGYEDAFINHIALQLKANPFFFLVPGQGEVTLHPIYIDDLVNVLLNTLENLNTVDAIIEVGGAEYISLQDLLYTVMRVTGTHRTLIGVPPYLLRWLTAFFSRVIPRSLITDQWMDLLATNHMAHIGNIYQYFGIKPHRLEDTLATYLPERQKQYSMWRYVLRRHPKVI